MERGTDIVSQRPVGDRSRVDLVLTEQERDELASRGIDARPIRVKGGLTIRQFAEAQAENGFQVWRSYDEPGGFRDQMYQIAAENPQITKLVVLGKTIQGREILAIKLTQGARGQRDGSRPAALYSALQHAREWISGEVNRRLLLWFIERWRANDKRIRDLLKETELWFVPVANPDGYQYTFDVERLWRKNLRDNDGDGQITVADGVDLNRNYPNHFKYDEEGSSSIPSSETYRGTSPASEPETQALKGLLDRIRFKFQVNYHSVGEWLLYAEGWQIATPTADDPIYFALSGNLDEPAIDGFHPGLSPDVLYVTNGETTDYAHSAVGTLAWTPELGDGCPDDDCGFVFPDDEAAVQEEFERNLPFALSIAGSATDPDDPESSLGIETKPFYLESDDPYKEGIPGTNFKFDYSYGDPQPVQVLAKRNLGAVTLKYRINGGPEQSAPTSEWTGGQRYTPADLYYREMRGVVTGTSPGDSVEAWFEGGGERSESFTYQAVSESGNRVLVVAAEDYTGASPGQTPGPHYVDYYLDALEANGVAADVYDVDASNRTAPDHIGVLSHYDAVIWYTGDDIVTRRTGWGAGNADRPSARRDPRVPRLHERGRSRPVHRRLGGPAVHGQRRQPVLRPQGRRSVFTAAPDVRSTEVSAAARLGRRDQRRPPILLRGLPRPSQRRARRRRQRVRRQRDRHTLRGPVVGLQRPGERRQPGRDVVVHRDQRDPSSDGVPAVRELGVVALGQAGRAVRSAHRRALRLLADRGRLVQAADARDRRASGGREPDVLDVLRHRGALGPSLRRGPDRGGRRLDDPPRRQRSHTTQETGDSCASGWRELHPHLDHYQTLNPDGTCTPTGTTGEWHAASGNSGGWQEWSIDLSEWAGETVEVSIAYASDWAVQNLGAFVDDVTLPDGTSTSFETGLDGWSVTGPPEGSGPNANNWIVTDSAGFPVGASISTPGSILMGFGFEGISTVEERNAVMGRVLQHLLP